jgi:hypothetical protein
MHRTVRRNIGGKIKAQGKASPGSGEGFAGVRPMCSVLGFPESTDTASETQHTAKKPVAKASPGSDLVFGIWVSVGNVDEPDVAPAEASSCSARLALNALPPMARFIWLC